MSNLNPVWKIGYQVKEALEANGIAKGKKAKEMVPEILAEAGLPDAGRRAKQYPHEFSGGMRQRAPIAIGLSSQPKLLIADELTSALDVTVQRTILDHIDTLTREQGVAVLFISHDLGPAAARAGHLGGMCQGRLRGSGPAKQILAAPPRPYTKRLVESAPSLTSRRIESARERGEEAEELLAPTAGEGEVATDDVVEVENLTKRSEERRVGKECRCRWWRYQ